MQKPHISLAIYHSTDRDIRQSRFAATSREAGMILVTVLFFMAAILALVIQAQWAARTALRFEDRQLLRAQLRVAASEAAWNALRVLAADDNLQVDHTNEDWAAWQTNRLPNDVETAAVIIDEDRYFNVNNLAAVPSNHSVRLPAAIVRDIFTAAGWPDPVGDTQALQDWVDRDSQGAREAGYYYRPEFSGSAGLEPPNAPMESPAELDGVLNAARNPARAAPPALTVLPDDPRAAAPRRTTLGAGTASIASVNVNTAGREVIQALLGAGRSALAETLCRRRDAQPVTDLAQALDARALAGLHPYLNTRSRYFTVAARAVRDGQQETVRALVRRDERGEIEILRWVCR